MNRRARIRYTTVQKNEMWDRWQKGESLTSIGRVRVYVHDGAEGFAFHYNKAPTIEQLTELLHTISQRVASFLERRGLLERDEDSSYLTLDGLDEDPMQELHSHSVTYPIAMGSQRERKVFTLQTIPPNPDAPSGSDRVAKLAGFSLHAGVAAKAHQRDKQERLCRYIARPAVSEKRLSLTSTGKTRYELKTPYRNSTTHVIFEPLDFIARLAALVPKPRVNLTRFHGVFAPNSKHRVHVTPARRGKGIRHSMERQDTGRTSYSHDLDAAIKTGVQYRRGDWSKLDNISGKGGHRLGRK